MAACALVATCAGAARCDNETLQFFEDEAQVTTASRERQSVREAPMSTEVITAKELRASGAVTLWDLLRTRAGLDVEDEQGNGLAVVSIRGFARSTVRQLQVLIDGRSVYSPTRSDIDWEELPVQLQDIERIEIVRGPNAALYGSNAGLGVIQIFTKKPAAASASAGALGGNLGLVRSEAAAEQSIGDFQFRLSQTRATRDGAPLPAGGRAGDFQFSNKENFRGRWKPSDDTDLDLLAGGSWDTLGLDSSFTGQHRGRDHFEMARLTRRLSVGELEVMAARNENFAQDDQAVGLVALRELQYDGEALLRTSWLDERLHGVAGAGYRLALAESDQLFAGDPKQQNRISRGFLEETARLTSWLTLTGAVAGERSDTAGSEPAYQFAAVLQPSAEQSLRLSYSVAPSLPSLFDEHANSLESPTKRRVGNPGLDDDHMTSYEAGYQRVLGEHGSVGTNAFYLVHQDLNESFTVGKAGGVTTTSFGNRNEALARGIEIVAAYRPDAASAVYANYTYEHATDRVGNLEVTGGFPQHKANVGGRWLWRGVSIGTSLGYKDAYLIGSTSSGFSTVAAYWRLDARLGYSPRPGVELFVASQNLTRPFHGPEFQRSEAVARAYEGGASMRFP